MQQSSNKCQDCGNQAKRECSYGRCRTCCKNKGFQCPTHIKSTWIPVERRRHREEEQDHPHHDHSHQFQGSDIPKKHKQHTTCSGSEELKFPAATSSVAVFRCVEVRSVDDAVNEIAYQTSVNIGGHVFSGLLYDQGPHQQSFSSSSGHLLDDHQHQNLSLVNNNANSNSIHTTHSHHQDGAKMAPLISATSNFAHDQPNLLVTPPPPPPPYHQFPLAPFGPGMPYFSHPKP